LVMDAKRVKPAGPWHACDGRRPPHTRPDQGPTRGASHDLAGADAAHGVHAGLDEAGEMGRGTQAAIRHEHSLGCEPGVHLRHLGEIVGEEGCDDPLQEHTGARLEEPPEVGHGAAAPRPRRRRWAEGVLEGRGSRPRAPRALAATGTRAMPSPVVQGGALHRSAEARSEASAEAQWECRAGWTVGGRAAPHARHMGERATGGVARQHLSQEELAGGDRREHPVAPREISHLAARGENRFGLQQGSPLGGEALKDGGDVWDHLTTACMAGYVIRQLYRRCVTRRYTGDA
jgi:hypothetical protein